MAFLNLLGRLGLDASSYFSTLRQSETAAVSTSGRIERTFSKMGKGLVGGLLGFGGVAQAINAYKALGNTIEEVQKKTREGTGKEMPEHAAADIALGNQAATGIWADTKTLFARTYAALATGLRAMGVTATAPFTGKNAIQDYNERLEASLERPEAMERMNKRLTEAKENQEKRAQDWRKDFNKAAKDLGITSLDGSSKDVQEKILRVLEKMEANQKANEGPLF